ncbi:MAG: cation-translocating P-type ATPase [Thermoflexales bacterium]|nr:cation-translocating P-type ATPase [Thermoflexales bacterium]
MSTEPYRRDAADVLAALGVEAATGLSQDEAARRLREVGPNQLEERGAKSPWRMLWEQFTATMVLILIGAGAFSVLIGKANEAISIFAIVILFGLLGFVQEFRAEKAMRALKALSAPNVRVRRAGSLRDTPSPGLVPGDIVQLEAGNAVPADLRLIESASLRIQEAALTGESEAVEKQPGALDGEVASLGDRINMAYMGTLVTHGRGIGVVVATGMRAELGRIASLLQNTRDTATPLQRRLDRLGKLLAIGGVVIAALVTVLGVLQGERLDEMVLTAVSVAVAIIPEGLPAVVTFTLALGARRMLKRNALIRKLPAVETLGAVTVICSDKTGTLTENRMTVVVLDVAGHRIEVDETLRQDAPVTSRHAPPLDRPDPALRLLLAGGALCNDASVELDATQDRLQTLGDPTEGALLVAAARGGLWPLDVAAAAPRRAELPFDSDRKRMTTLNALGPGTEPALRQAAPEAAQLAITKGAIDSLLTVSTHAWLDDKAVPLTAELRARIERANADLAGKGMRVLGVAVRGFAGDPLQDWRIEAIERDMVFVGMFGIVDPPRAEAREAVRVAVQAGIRPVMITGDHPLTARYIAEDLGLLPPGTDGAVLTGQALAALPPTSFDAAVERTRVFARVAPEQKLRIVEALQRHGHVVAMTGDGVNDAPALKQSDVGVAMGITGTDVSKEAADVVLRDDNFATIVAAVEEGRAIYDNVRRFIKFSLGGNVGKVAVMLLAPLLGMPVALLPLQLLWLNLLTDGVLGLGMGFEPAERDAMRRPPISPKSSILGQGVGRGALWVGVLIAAITLGLGMTFRAAGRPEAQTLMFTVLAFAQVGQAMASRSHRQSFFRLSPGGNRPLLAMALGVVAAQLLVVSVPFLAGFFQTVALDGTELLLAVGAGVIVFAAIEIEKALLRRSPALRPAA